MYGDFGDFMFRKIALALMIIGLVGPAVAGAAPTLFGRVDFDAAGLGYTTITTGGGARHFDVNDEGWLLHAYEYDSGTGLDRLHITQYNRQMQIVTETDFGCSPNDCNLLSVKYDYLSNIVVIYFNGVDYLLVVFDGGTGQNSAAFDDVNLADLTPTLGAGSTAFESIPVGAAVEYVVADSAANRVARLNATTGAASLQVWNQAVTKVQDLRYDSGQDLLVAHQRSTLSQFVKLNPATGATLDTEASGATVAQDSGKIPHFSSTTADIVYLGISTGTAGATTMGYSRYDAGASSHTAATFADGGVGLPADSDMASSALDGDDDLVMGNSLKVTPDIYKGNTANDTMEWKVPVDVDADDATASESILFVGFDYANGFWAVGYNSNSDHFAVLRYTGGNLTQPNARGFTAPATTLIPGTGNDSPIETIKDDFIEAWGVNEEVGNWLFAIATISLIIVGFLRFSQSPVVLMIALFLGVGLAWALGFLPVWFLLFLVFLVVVVASNSLFGGNGSDAE